MTMTMPLSSSSSCFCCYPNKFSPLPYNPNPKSPLSKINNPKHSLKCTTTLTQPSSSATPQQNISQPSIWHFDYIQSLTNDYSEESQFAEERERLISRVGFEVFESESCFDQLQHVDSLQRLGVARHFGLQISKLLHEVYYNIIIEKNYDFFAAPLQFRLLRQYNYPVSSEILKGFEENEERGDMKRILWLYEASFQGVEGEIILDEAREFSSGKLKEFVEENKEGDMLELVKHALELPLHWRTPRIEASWFINYYKGRRTHNNINNALLKLAVLDFNMVQLYHQQDLKHASRWWKVIGFVDKLSFSRDMLVENFLWTVGLAYEPQFGEFRRTITKVNALITAIDDIYDAYATLPELQLFTQAVDRWDVNEVDILPEYMKICFLELYTFVNEAAASASLKENGVNITPQLKKVWADLCKSYLTEAKWYDGGYRPGLPEYMENAWVSIGAPVVLAHVYFLLKISIQTEEWPELEQYHEITRLSATIVRLANDLGSSKLGKESGDVAKAVECYMNENKVCKADAQMHINSLIHTAWKKMNKEAGSSLGCCFSKGFIEISINLARISLCMYQHGDGHTFQYPQTKNHVISLLFKHVDFSV